MGERDAFGREKDENTLKDMGWSTPPASRRRDEPPVVASRDSLPGMGADVNHDGIPGSHAPPSRTFPEHRGVPTPTPRRRRRSGGGGLGSIVAILFVIGVFGSVILGVIGAIVDAVDSVETSGIDRPSAPSVADEDEGGETETPAAVDEEPASTEPAAPPQGLQPGSLLLAKNFGAVKATMRTGRFGKLKNFSIRPDRMNAQFVTKDGRLRSVQFSPGGKAEELSVSGPGFAGTQTIPIAPINSAAPYRMARSAAGRLKRPATDVDYVVYFGEDFVGNIVWGVFMRDGKAFQGDTRGRIIRQIR